MRSLTRSHLLPEGPRFGVDGEPDRYASYNYAEGSWAVGNLSRTAWSDSGIRQNPFCVLHIFIRRFPEPIYTHEDGLDADGSAMDAYIESGYFDIEDGEHFSFISRFIPDVYFG